MDGIIVVNKSKGCTSHDVVYQVKKIFGTKVGHTGTLDPNATGVLPILIGKGTELSQFLINHDKKYIATLKLGIKTDTADSEGNVIKEQVVDSSVLTQQNINNIFKSMIGKQKQIPPMYSAIKVKGKKLYEYARKGQTVEIPEREIEIYDLKLIECNLEENTITFEIYCSKGTYIRTVCEKIAEKLNTIGYMKELERTMVGDFNLEDSITIDELKQCYDNKNFMEKNLISIEKLFINESSIKLDDRKLELVLNGVCISNNMIDGIVRIYNKSNKFIGIGINTENKLKRKIIV